MEPEESGSPSEAPAVCAVCNDITSQVYCQQCEDSMCAECSETVHQGKMAYHFIVPIEGELPERCAEHPREVLDFHCEECHAIVCGRCLLLGAHRGHTCCPLDFWYEEMTSSLRADAVGILQERDVISEHLGTLLPLIPAIEAACQGVDEHVQLEMDGLRAALVERESQIFDEIDAVSHTRTGALRLQEQQLRAQLDTLTDIFDRVQDVTEIDEENSFLLSDPMQLKLLIDQVLDTEFEFSPCVPLELDFLLDIKQYRDAIDAIELGAFQSQDPERKTGIAAIPGIVKPALRALKFA